MKTRMLIVLLCAVVLGACAGVPSRVDDGTRIIANVDPVEVGKVGVGTKSVFGSKITQSEAIVVFEPKTNHVLLTFKHEALKGKLTLSEKARTLFIEAVAQYRKSFDERSLNVRAKNTNRIYGSVDGQIEWGLMAYNGRAIPKIKYGYIFVERKTPYFTITVPSSGNLGDQLDDVESDDNSPTMVLHFTKNQSTELAELLIQDNLEGILQERGIRDYSETGDVYEQ